MNTTFEVTEHCKQRYGERIDWNSSHLITNMLSKAKDITNEIFNKYPSYILYLKQKYGKSNILLKHENILFICQKKFNKIRAVTCYPITEYTFKQFESIKPKKEIYFELAKLKLQKN